MKKFLVIALLAIANFASAQQMKFKGELEQTKDQLAKQMVTWQDDANGNDAALIRVKIENMTLEQKKKLTASASSTMALSGVKFNEERQELWLFVAADADNGTVEISHPDYGTSNKLRIEKELGAKKIYDVVLVNDKTVTITVGSKPAGAMVKIDGESKGTTPLTIADVTLGEHALTLTLGDKIRDKVINVDEVNISFEDFDLQDYQQFTVENDAKGAQIFINDSLYGNSPLQVSLPYGRYKFSAKIGEAYDEKDVTVNAATKKVELQTTNKCQLTIKCFRSGDPIVASGIISNGKANEDVHLSDQKVYTVSLPYGNYKANFTSGTGHGVEKKLKLNQPTMSQDLKFKALSKFTWPWDRDFESQIVSFSAGYVQKKIVLKGTDNGGRGYTDTGNYASMTDTPMHGLRAGFQVIPTFSFGLGLYTGVFYEFYAQNLNISSSESNQYSYTEHNISVPVYAYFRLPFSEKFAVHLFGGLGNDFRVAEQYKNKEDDSYKYSMKEMYENNLTIGGVSASSIGGGPGFYNLSGDIGAMISWGKFRAEFIYSIGIINHSGFVDIANAIVGTNNYESAKINKMAFSVAYGF